jgi:hypothetical protein
MRSESLILLIELGLSSGGWVEKRNPTDIETVMNQWGQS